LIWGRIKISFISKLWSSKGSELCN
jgi:hypothetical protein